MAHGTVERNNDNWFGDSGPVEENSFSSRAARVLTFWCALGEVGAKVREDELEIWDLVLVVRCVGIVACTPEKTEILVSFISPTEPSSADTGSLWTGIFCASELPLSENFLGMA